MAFDGIIHQDYFATGLDNTTTQKVAVHFPRAATIFAAAASILFIFVGVLGNFVTIIALKRNLKLRLHATTAFVISLCASDLLFCTINLPLTASRYIHEEWVLGEALCKIFPFFFYGNVAASLMNMVAITLNRYILISHHSIYDRIYKKRNIWIMVICIWLFSFGMMVPPLLQVWGQLGLDPPTFSCTILKKDGASPKKFLFLFGILVPCVVIIGCYSAIYYKVRQSRQKMAAHMSTTTPARVAFAPNTKPKKSQAKKEDMRLTRMMLIIFLCFLFSFFPLMIVNVADDAITIPTLHVLASVLSYASSVVNPFVYAFTNRQYRSAYKKLLCWPGCCLPANKSAAYHDQSNTSKTFMTDFHYQASTGAVTTPPEAPPAPAI